MSYEGMFSLKDKIALVTGAAGGLAFETCLGLGQFGAAVALADLDSKGLAKVSDQLRERGIQTWSKEVNVSDEASVSSLISASVRKFKKLDILINFAGVVWTNPIEKIRTLEFEKVIDINLKGSFLLSQKALRVMVPNQSGKIILVGSVSGQIGRPFAAHYSASKGGVHSLVRTLAVETAKQNIQVNAIAPVFTLTKLSQSVLSDPKLKRSILSTIPMGRLGLPSDLVGSMIFLSSAASNFITGQTFCVDGGCTIS
jgi:NAD(P)-dependent dehydrogenase (short-subunit alcohol dehydrogenase family)